MAGPPEIPGFYYDPDKRKYFKIVNGDQRHNLNYSNNTIRSRRRAIEFEERIRSPETEYEQCLSKLSKNAKRLKTCPLEHTLNHMLGVGSPSGYLSPAFILNHLQSFTFRSGFQALCMIDDDHILTLRYQIHFMVFNTAEFCDAGIKAIPRHSKYSTLLPAPPKYIESSEDWTFARCKNGSQYLLRWVKKGGRWGVENHTETYLQKLRLAAGDILSPNTETYAKPHEGKLYILTENRWMIVMSLIDLSYELTLLTRVDTPIPQGTILNITGCVWYFSVGKTVYVGRSNRDKILKWKFQDHVIKILVEELKVHDSQATSSYYTFVIITNKEIITRTIELGTMDISSEDSPISIHNNNQSCPMIVKLGPQILIQESPHIFKLVDLNMNTEEDIEVPGLASWETDSLGSIVRVLQLKKKYVVAVGSLVFIQSKPTTRLNVT